MKATILTVEDDPIVRADLRLILENADFAVSEARDGVEAVERAREDRPDLILLDLGLPKLDGVTAARHILDERIVPIVALTGRSNAEGRAGALAAGAIDVVLKPFGELELLAKLREALVRRRPFVRPAWDEEEDRLRTMVESMVARGRSHSDVTSALRRATR
jgi:DNA-binding response OmpR family regulator